MKSLFKTKLSGWLRRISFAVVLRNLLVASILSAAVYAYSQLDFHVTARLDGESTELTLDQRSLTRLLPVLVNPASALGN